MLPLLILLSKLASAQYLTASGDRDYIIEATLGNFGHLKYNSDFTTEPKLSLVTGCQQITSDYTGKAVLVKRDSSCTYVTQTRNF